NERNHFVTQPGHNFFDFAQLFLAELDFVLNRFMPEHQQRVGPTPDWAAVTCFLPQNAQRHQHHSRCRNGQSRYSHWQTPRWLVFAQMIRATRSVKCSLTALPLSPEPRDPSRSEDIAGLRRALALSNRGRAVMTDGNAPFST